MDRTDRKILDILEKDGRRSYTEIADDVGVSEGTVRNRVEKMQEEDVIERFTVDTSTRGVSAVMLVEISTEAEIESILERFPEDLRVYEVTGENDLVVFMDRQEREELNSDIDDIRRIEGVTGTKTLSVLKERRL